MTFTPLGAAKNGGKELVKAAAKEGAEFVGETTAKTATKEVAKTTGETLTETIAKTIAKTATKEATEALGEKVAKESTEFISEKLAQDATKDGAENAVKTAEKKVVEDSTKTVTKKSADDVAENAAKTDKKVADGDSKNGNIVYSVAFETKLSSNSYPGVYRGAHFKEANLALENAINNDAQFANMMNNLGIIVPKSQTGNILGKSPAGWVWHHDVAPGSMQLVPKNQHTPGSDFWNTLHLNGKGGFSIWGK